MVRREGRGRIVVCLNGLGLGAGVQAKGKPLSVICTIVLYYTLWRRFSQHSLKTFQNCASSCVGIINLRRSDLKFEDHILPNSDAENVLHSKPVELNTCHLQKHNTTKILKLYFLTNIKCKALVEQNMFNWLGTKYLRLICTNLYYPKVRLEIR